MDRRAPAAKKEHVCVRASCAHLSLFLSVVVLTTLQYLPQGCGEVGEEGGVDGRGRSNPRFFFPYFFFRESIRGIQSPVLPGSRVSPSRPTFTWNFFGHAVNSTCRLKAKAKTLFIAVFPNKPNWQRWSGRWCIKLLEKIPRLICWYVRTTVRMMLFLC